MTVNVMVDEIVFVNVIGILNIHVIVNAVVTKLLL